MERIACSAATCVSGDFAEHSRSCVASVTPWPPSTSSRVDSGGEKDGKRTVFVQSEDDGGGVSAKSHVVAVEREQREQEREEVDRLEEAATGGCDGGRKEAKPVLERLCETATMPKMTLCRSL